MNGRDINSNQFPEVYKALDIDTNKLGVVMLDTTPLTLGIDPLDLYFARNEERFWIRGAVAESGAHVTLLYGLLQHGTKWKPLIDKVLEGWTPPPIEFESIGTFPTPFEDEPYTCIIAHVKVTDELLEGHARLELLPHINTFARYRPHLTLAYVNKGTEDKYLSDLSDSFVGHKLEVTDLNYGTERGATFVHVRLNRYTEGEKVQVIKNEEWIEGFINSKEATGALNVHTVLGPVTVASSQSIRKVM